jgi:hypothetical protein
MNFYELMKYACSTGETIVHDDETRLVRFLPAIPTQSAKTTGMVIDGHFEMFRGTRGQMIFVGQEGQFIKK